MFSEAHKYKLHRTPYIKVVTTHRQINANFPNMYNVCMAKKHYDQTTIAFHGQIFPSNHNDLRYIVCMYTT